MKTETAQKRRPKGLMNAGVIVAAVVISLMIQGSAQAWWTMSLYLVWRGGW
ncbi:MAG: hypothetical protein JSU70_02405 [Phycisphaerales bacterium]|nr:MAG: hypothetical protein JSU70_02405 [Phycisphaerales bacterium]